MTLSLIKYAVFRGILTSSTIGLLFLSAGCDLLGKGEADEIRFVMHEILDDSSTAKIVDIGMPTSSAADIDSSAYVSFSIEADFVDLDVWFDGNHLGPPAEERNDFPTFVLVYVGKLEGREPFLVVSPLVHSFSYRARRQIECDPTRQCRGVLRAFLLINPDHPYMHVPDESFYVELTANNRVIDRLPIDPLRHAITAEMEIVSAEILNERLTAGKEFYASTIELSSDDPFVLPILMWKYPFKSDYTNGDYPGLSSYEFYAPALLDPLPDDIGTRENPFLFATNRPYAEDTLHSVSLFGIALPD